MRGAAAADSAARADAALGEERRRAPPVAGADDVEVPDRLRPFRHGRKAEIAEAVERPEYQAARDPLRIPTVEARQLVHQRDACTVSSRAVYPTHSCTYFERCPCSRRARARSATASSSVTSAPASPIAPRFLPG